MTYNKQTKKHKQVRQVQLDHKTMIAYSVYSVFKEGRRDSDVHPEQ